MYRWKKLIKLLIYTVRHPKVIKQGLIYLRLHGIRGFINGVKVKSYNISGQNTAEQFTFFNPNIKFSIVMPVYNVEIKWLQKAIDSVLNQTYKNWELCLVDDCSTDRDVKEFLSKINHPNVKVKLLEQNGGISKASNEGVDMATGNYIILMDNDDVISTSALFEFSTCISSSNADIIYSDQDIIDQEGNHREPVCKPDWSPDLLLSQMYIGHLLGFKKELFYSVGGFRTEFNGSQDYDLLLRMIEQTNNIKHVSKILYSWRDIPSSTAANPQSKPYAQTAGLNAIQEHLNRTYGEGKAKVFETDNLFVYDVRYPIAQNIKASIIIPVRDHIELLENLLDSIFKKSTYKNYEIIILNNNSELLETFEYFEKLISEHSNVKVENAFYEFNWSKLNNHGISVASGDIYIFMNNDMEIITVDWMERLIENASRDDVGVVCPLLLFEDGTIQHAGIVAGMGGWAEHVYRGMPPIHYGTPFISPVLTRNVTACTGACMAISKKVVEKIGLFSEKFIICGSDVEICIRAYQHGLKNIYNPHIQLYHYESKTRDKFIPEIDYKLSYSMYETYRNYGDPYYNNQLDYYSYVPKIKVMPVTEEGSTEEKYNCVKEDNKSNTDSTIEELNVSIPEITPFTFRISKYKNKRLNLLVPSLNKEHVFGGISTALKFYYELQNLLGYDSRIILTDAAPTEETIKDYSDKYTFVKPEEESNKTMQIVAYNDRYNKSIGVSKNDYFMFTGWWTAYCTQEAYHRFEREYHVKPNTFINFIQDYEPGFYAWSSRYLLADSTYRSEYPQIAVFNTNLLKDFFDINKYKFYKSYVFEPVLNSKLKEILYQNQKLIQKKKQILVYGRPSVTRNAFELVVESLRKWVHLQEDIEEWTILSAGEMHGIVQLGMGKQLVSVGKLTIEQYADILLESYAGISLMASPHPSYPPLEMSEYGVKVITNNYSNKDLSNFNQNITSLVDISPTNIAKKLNEICNNFTSEYNVNIMNKEYCENNDVFSFINELSYILDKDGK